MLARSRVFALIGVAAVTAACRGITIDDPRAVVHSPDRAALAAAGSAQICHRTNGTSAFLLLRVNGNAVDAHLAHGDHRAITFYRIGSPADTVVACEAPPGYSDSPNGCAPVFSFEDNFDAAILDAKWLPMGFGVAQLCAGEVCGEVQSGSYRACIGEASTHTISFDFHTDGIESREVWAFFSAGNPFEVGTTAYGLGCDGGFSGAGNQATCGLTISVSEGPPTGPPVFIVPQIDAGLQTGVVYRLVATATTSGALTVEIFQGTTLMARRDAQVAGPINVSSVGFVVGRATDGFLTYLDNFRYTSTP